jgi:hypothetical protein
MANRERGEVSIEVGGTTYTLRPTINAICDVEDLTGDSFTQLAQRAGAGDIRSMRALLWAYLQEQHSDEIKTVRDAGLWVNRAGGLAALEGKLREITQLNAPPSSSTNERPREAQPEAGVISTLRRVGSA